MHNEQTLCGALLKHEGLGELLESKAEILQRCVVHYLMHRLKEVTVLRDAVHCLCIWRLVCDKLENTGWVLGELARLIIMLGQLGTQKAQTLLDRVGVSEAVKQRLVEFTKKKVEGQEMEFSVGRIKNSILHWIETSGILETVGVPYLDRIAQIIPQDNLLENKDILDKVVQIQSEVYEHVPLQEDMIFLQQISQK